MAMHSYFPFWSFCQRFVITWHQQFKGEGKKQKKGLLERYLGPDVIIAFPFIQVVVVVVVIVIVLIVVCHYSVD